MVPLHEDFVPGGAWPILVRVLKCLVYSDNERDDSGVVRMLGANQAEALTPHFVLEGRMKRIARSGL